MRWPLGRNEVGSLEAPQKPIVPSPADTSLRPPQAMLDAAKPSPSFAEALVAVADLRSERDELWGWCFESHLILHRVRDHGLDALTDLERASVLRISENLDRIIGKGH